MSNFRHLTLRERLDRFPPFLCVALARVKVSPLTQAEKQVKYWNRKARENRRRLRSRGIALPKRPAWRRLTLLELADKAHISVRLIKDLTVKTHWHGVSVFTFVRLTETCGIDLLRIKSKLKYLKDGLGNNRAFAHLNPQQMRQVIRLWGKWKA